MKVSKPKISHKKSRKNQMMEDMRYLQKRISGRSVYSKLSASTKRSPKHKNRAYLTELS